MNDKNFLAYLIGNNQLMNQMEFIREINQKTEKFGLTLTKDEAELLVKKRVESLREQQRIEFGEGVLTKIIFTFCDSPYIDQNNYVETVIRLQEIFYYYKNEALDELTDDELLEYMKESFDRECEGSLEFLEETVLERFAREIRSESSGFFGSKFQLEQEEEFDE